MGERSPQICTTVDKPTAAILAQIREETGISEVELTRALLKAATRHYEKHGSITLPLALTEVTRPAERTKRAS